LHPASSGAGLTRSAVIETLLGKPDLLAFLSTHLCMIYPRMRYHYDDRVPLHSPKSNANTDV
jgi:hypothetical protein